MNTLNKTITSKFFVNPSDYNTLVKRWSELVNSPEGKTLQSCHFLWYLVLRGKNYKKSFFPGRMMQHHTTPQGLYNAKNGRYNQKYVDFFTTYFGDILVLDWQNKIKTILPNLYDQIESDDCYNNAKVESLFEIEVKPKIEKKTILSKIRNILHV